MLAVAGLAQQVIGAAADDIDAVLDEALEGVEQAQLARLAVDDRQQDDAEVDLHLRVLVQVVEDDFGLLAALQLEHDAHAVAVALVADFGDAFELLFVDQAGAVLDQAGFVDLVGKLGDDDGFAVLAHLFGGGFGAHLDGAAAGREVIVDALAAQDDAAGGEIGALHHLDQILGSWMAGFCTSAMQASTISLRLCGGILLAMPTAMPSLPLTSRLGMRVGRTSGSIFAFVVVGLEVDGFLVDVFEQRGGDAGQARFGVPHGRGRIAIDGTEVALAVDQRIAHREMLRHADQGVVDRGVAVRVVAYP